MGTRADFYMGKGKDAEWIGSIAWDGYRDGIPDEILNAKTTDEFRSLVSVFLQGREDASFPKDGWPWPWDDSQVTDCSYWFFDGQVFEDFSRHYYPATKPYPDNDTIENGPDEYEQIAYPDMSGKEKKPLFGPHSGVMVFHG